MMAETARAPLPSAAGERTTANWHDHRVTSLKPDMTDCPAVQLVWCGDISGEVGVMGSWDGWSKVWKLNRSGNGEYSVALKIPCGQHEYKFRVNNTWFHDETKPTVCNSFGTLNNLVNVVKASNGPSKPGINGTPEKPISNGTNGPLQASNSILPPKTAKEIYEHKTTTATTHAVKPQIQEILKPEPGNGFSQPPSNGHSNQANGKADFSSVEPQPILVDASERMQQKPPPQRTTSYRVPPTVPPKPAKETVATAQAACNRDPQLVIKNVSGAEPVQQTCPLSKSTENRVSSTVPPKVAKEAAVTAPVAVNPEPLLVTKAASKTTASRVSQPKVPPKATTTAPQTMRVRPEVPQKRLADKTGKPVAGTAGGAVRKPETAPPKARTTFEKPPVTKPKPTQKRVVTTQATSRTAAKTVDGKGSSSQPGQTETRQKTFAGRKV